MEGVFFTKGKDEQDNCQEETYGFKTRKCPPQLDDMIEFEKDLWSMVETVKCCRVNDTLQERTREDLPRIRRSDDMLVAADKTRNLYSVDTDLYSKLLTDNVSEHYRHAPRSYLR
eukprot:scpid92694/ scgid23379/ 